MAGAVFLDTSWSHVTTARQQQGCKPIHTATAPVEAGNEPCGIGAGLLLRIATRISAKHTQQNSHTSGNDDSSACSIRVFLVHCNDYSGAGCGIHDGFAYLPAYVAAVSVHKLYVTSHLVRNKKVNASS